MLLPVAAHMTLLVGAGRIPITERNGGQAASDPAGRARSPEDELRQAVAGHCEVGEIG